MLAVKRILHEKYKTERSAELALAFDITYNSASAVLYDLALERRFARSVMFGAEFSPKSASGLLSELTASALEEHRISPAAVKSVGIAAAVPIHTELERSLTASALGLDSCGLLFLPYISAGISGRFTASLLTLPDEDFIAADFGKSLCIALKSEGGLRCASFPLSGAFDGTALESGMPAENGAIDVVCRENDKTVAYEVAGDGDGVGISPCGALTAAAEMARCGIINSDGIMLDRDLLFIGEDIFVSQNDIRAVQTDKARSAAAFELLCGNDADVRAFFSGEPFSRAEGFRTMLDMGAIPRSFGSAAYCRSSAEQGVVMFLADKAARDRAFGIASSAEDISCIDLDKFDDFYLNHLNFHL